MMVRLVLGVVLVANILVLVVCSAETTQATATSESSASTTSTSSDVASSSSSDAAATSKPVKCRRGKKCPKNEEFSPCAQLLPRAQYCSEKTEPFSTSETPPDKPSCKEACVCKENYLRAENGTCIPAEQCPLSCGANEVLDNCPSDCDSDYCPTEEVSEAATCATPDVCPPPICKCAFNHRRASNGSCIPTRDCPPFACKTNEEFNACPPLCPTDDCSQASPTGQCPPRFGHIGIILPCNPKCRCIKDFWRLDGICVFYGQCPGVCPAHERYSGCLQGECKALNCTQKDQSIACPRIDPKYCEKGCVCEEGYLRNADGVCVSEDKCEPLQPSCISDNEEYVTCMQGVCRAKNCSQKGQDVPCPDVPPEECDSGCICKEHFLRAANGTCVPEDKCEPTSCPINEELSNCSQAVCRAQDCYDRYLSIPCPSIPEGSCEKGCVCKWGYLRDRNNVCIPSDECPTHSCEHNKRPTNCTQAKCVQKCFEEKMPQGCPLIAEGDCKEGCVCQEGYLEAEDGYCVPEDQCESTKCPPFEQWSFCSNAVCRAEHCYQKGWSLPCPSVSRCDPGCLCQGGYLRDESGVCVPEEECKPMRCPLNEEFSNCTQGVCRVQNCSDRLNEFVCPTVTEGECEEGCVCKEGYLRVEDGLYCVPKDQCNANKCPIFEQWDDCANGVCRANHCSEKGLPLPCPAVSECKPGCLCRDNFLRDESGFCVPQEDCNARNCSANEEWSACAQATCRTQNCTDKGKPVVCPMITDGFCEEACVCKENYLRNENGECVPEDKCEPQLTCGKNEVLDDCPPSCNTDNCPQSADDEEKWCVQADPCVPACKCRFNYKRAANGTCIPTADCPAFDCSAKPNEEFASCPPFCPSDECGKPRLEGRCPYRIGVVLQCKPKCQCKDGYGRVNDTCVPFAECPDLCPVNEVYSPCMQQTCRPQNCSSRDVAMETTTNNNCNNDKDVDDDDDDDNDDDDNDDDDNDDDDDDDDVTIDKPSCQRGCVCQENFYRNEEGVCVTYKECGARNCSANEEWSTCAQATCRAQNCTDKGKPVVCPMITDGSCEEACVCKENYLRNENGDCVPEDQCEPQLTCGKNEVLDDCPPTCNTDNCPQSADDEDVWCAQADPCVPACKCRFNYKRAANGTCIPTTGCPAFDCSAKPNEEYVSCPPFCPSDECGKPRLEGRCPYRIGVVLQCKPKCQCKDGYGRVNDTCVPFAECPDLCPANEVYSPCMQQTCRPQNCSNRDVAMDTCPTIDEASCQRGCVCQENFYRNDGGVCVSYKECGGPICQNAHEVYEPNFKKCPPNTCNSLVAKYKCAGDQKGIPACACEPGYLRLNETSPCIPICECPQMKSSPDCK